MLKIGFDKKELDKIKKRIEELVIKSYQKARNDEFNNVKDLKKKVFY